MRFVLMRFAAVICKITLIVSIVICYAKCVDVICVVIS